MSIASRRRLVYLVIAGSLLMAANLIKDIIRLNRADERLAEAETKLRSAKQEQAELQSQLKIVGDDFWLEKQIRNVLKMARPEEVVVVIPEEVFKGASFRPGAFGPGQDETAGNPEQWLKVFGF